MKEDKFISSDFTAQLLESYPLNLSDFALFLSVMKNKEAYECTLSLILDEADLELEEVKVEEVILNQSASGLSVWTRGLLQRTNDNLIWKCKMTVLPMTFQNAPVFIRE